MVNTPPPEDGGFLAKLRGNPRTLRPRPVSSTHATLVSFLPAVTTTAFASIHSTMVGRERDSVRSSRAQFRTVLWWVGWSKR